MKKIIVMALLSAFMLNTYAAVNFQQDTMKHGKKSMPAKKTTKKGGMGKDTMGHKSSMPPSR